MGSGFWVFRLWVWVLDFLNSDNKFIGSPGSQMSRHFYVDVGLLAQAY